MNLAHPPGHIFWKTEPQVDRLSLFIERVLSGSTEGSHSSQDTHTTSGCSQATIQALVNNLYNQLFTNDLMFARVFELPPKNLVSENGLHFNKIGEKEYECRLFLRRFIDQTCCQVVYGAQHDIPPGMAVYKLNSRMTNEQKAFVKDEWGPCMDDEGFMSPAKMYPWFAMGVVNAVQTIVDKNNEDAKTTEELFEDIVVAGEYPVVKLVIPSKKEDPNTQHYKTSNTNLSSLLNSNLSISGLVKNEDIPTPCEDFHKESNTKGLELCSKKPLTRAQWYPRGTEVQNKPNCKQSKHTPITTPRSSVMSDPNSSKTFSSFSREVETIQEEIKEEPYVIIIKPAIKGYGLPSGIKLQHALPKQKPFCDTGKECLKSIQEKLEDGQSLWYLEAATFRMTPNVESSARFKSMMRKIGQESKLWNINFTPITRLIEKNMTETFNATEFSVDLEKVKRCINIMKTYHGWNCMSDSLVNIALMNVVKNNMLTARSLGQITVKMIQFLQYIAENQSCPAFLQPNVNVAQDMNKEEGKWVAAEMKNVVREIEKDPGYILFYIGYQKRND